MKYDFGTPFMEGQNIYVPHDRGATLLCNALTRLLTSGHARRADELVSECIRLGFFSPAESGTAIQLRKMLGL